MSYSSLLKADVVTTVPSLTRTNTVDAASVRAHVRQDSPNTIETTILLTPEMARTTGFRAGSRVTLLRGTGKDKNKIRLVANRRGTYRFGKTAEGSLYTLRLRTARLRSRPLSTKGATVTSYGKGVITLSL